jgi:O-antigen/teichoic acid export membrane protein
LQEAYLIRFFKWSFSIESPERDSLASSILHTFKTSVFVVFLGFVVSATLARLLGPSSFGAYELSLATATLLLFLFNFSLSAGITFLVSRRETNLERLRPQLLWISLGQGVLGFGMAEILRQSAVASAFFPGGSDSSLSCLLAVYVFLMSLGLFGRGILIGRGEIIFANRVDATTKLFHVGALVMLAILVHWFSLIPTYSIALLILVSAAGTASFVFWHLSGRPWTGTRSDSGLRKAFRFATPTHMANVTQFLNYRLDIFIVGYFVGVTGVGLYALASVIAHLVLLLPKAVGAVLFPYIAGISDNQMRVADTLRAVRLSFLISVFVAVIVGLVARPLLSIGFGENFVASRSALLWLLPGVAMYSIADVVRAYFFGLGKPGANFIGSLVGLSVTVPMAVYLIPRFGIVGASVASSISYAATVLIALMYFRSQTGVPLAAIIIPSVADLTSLKNFTRKLTR